MSTSWRILGGESLDFDHLRENLNRVGLELIQNHGNSILVCPKGSEVRNCVWLYKDRDDRLREVMTFAQNSAEDVIQILQDHADGDIEFANEHDPAYWEEDYDEQS